MFEIIYVYIYIQYYISKEKETVRIIYKKP